MMMQAIDMYRSSFRPSEQLSEPYVMLGFNVCAAETDEEAQFLRTSSLQAIIRLRRGKPGQLPPPVRNLELSPEDEAIVSQFSQCSAVGGADTIAESLIGFAKRTGADELMIAGQIYDHDARIRSYEILADVHSSLVAAEPVDVERVSQSGV
jgi:alkanesulfonate monooxygenase SsuD/methylene tetrahydromethanopterin reductase-like flavin-dependent oxidoreductase (luciferase family)